MAQTNAPPEHGRVAWGNARRARASHAEAQVGVYIPGSPHQRGGGNGTQPHCALPSSWYRSSGAGMLGVSGPGVPRCVTPGYMPAPRRGAKKMREVLIRGNP